MNPKSAPVPSDPAVSTQEDSWEAQLLGFVKFFTKNEQLKQCAINNDSVRAALNTITQSLSNLHRLHVYSRRVANNAKIPEGSTFKFPGILLLSAKVKEGITQVLNTSFRDVSESEEEQVSLSNLSQNLRSIEQAMGKAYSGPSLQATLVRLLFFPLPPPGNYDEVYPPTFMEISPEIHPWLTEAMANLQEASSASESAIKSYFEEHYGDMTRTVANDLQSEIKTLRSEMQSIAISDSQASERERHIPDNDRRRRDAVVTKGPALLVVVGNQQPGHNNNSSSMFFLPPDMSLGGSFLNLPHVEYTVPADEGSLNEQFAEDNALSLLHRISSTSNISMEDALTGILSRLDDSVNWVKRSLA